MEVKFSRATFAIGIWELYVYVPGLFGLHLAPTLGLTVDWPWDDWP